MNGIMGDIEPDPMRVNVDRLRTLEFDLQRLTANDVELTDLDIGYQLGRLGAQLNKIIEDMEYLI